ncbi:hypothetical protein OROMI_005066 [Orobanche minor]
MELLGRKCYSLGVEDLELLSGEELHMPNSYLIIFNGLILGKHRRPQRFANAMRKLRRAGKIGHFVSIFVNEKQRCVYIASDGGRVCRPLVIADKGVSRIKEHYMKELKVGIRTFDSFLKEGLLEYLDVNEENNSLIALHEENAKEGTTHIEIEPFTILGVVAGLIPYPHHNQSPRNTYQCAMGKQAMGNIAYNQGFRSFPSTVMLSRMDTLMYLLVYPQRPLLTTRTIELVNYDKLGAGQNATVAVMSYSGYDIEDAIVMNKSSLDRGFGRCIVMKKMTTVLQKYDNGTSDHFGPVKGTGGMQILDDDGLAAPGQTIRTDDIYMNKKTPKSTRAKHNFCMDGADSLYNDTPLRYSGDKGETAVVDRVVLTSDRNNNLCVKFMIRHTRRPDSLHGQKGVCGTIVQQEDFPFSERGICPDLIMNPHGFPSRMTVGKMIELLGSKAGVQCGRFHYGSAFGEPSGHADKVETISMVLTTPAKTSSTQCITGEPLEAYIFMGPIYYQKLKHMRMVVRDDDFEMDKQALAAPVPNAVDKFHLVPEFLKVRGLMKQHLDSFNYFVRTQIKKIVQANDLVTCREDPSIYLRYKDVRIDKPSVMIAGVADQLTPQMCRLSDMTYAAPIYVNIEYITGSHGTKATQIKKNVLIGRMPIMLRSCCCVLYGKDEQELAKYGECPLDPGGYFVVKGTEKVILIQEQLSNNRIIIDADKKGCVQASVTSSTEATKSKTVIKMEKEKINLYLNQFTTKVPIMIVLKAMGMESDQEVVQMIGRDPRYSELLLPSIEDCVVNKVHTQYQALEYLEQKAKKFPSTTYEKEGRALSILRNLFLANVPVRQNNFRPKCIYVAVMLRRMMEAILNKDAMDDKSRVWPFNGEVRDGNSRLTNFIDYRGNGDAMCDIKSANVGNDYVGNKRLELSGQMIAILFEDSFKSMNEEARSLIDRNYLKIRSSRLDISQYILKDRITVELERSISTGNWKIRRFRMDRKGMTQVVARLSYIGTLGYMTRISPQFEKSRKVSGPRALQPSQWGMLCPCDTPEGESCGLVKNLALMTHVTTDEDEGPLMSLVYNLILVA